jgi:hypothetical protein
MDDFKINDKLGLTVRDLECVNPEQANKFIEMVTKPAPNMLVNLGDKLGFVAIHYPVKHKKEVCGFPVVTKGE